MSTIPSFLLSAGCLAGAIRELACCTLRFAWVMLLPRAQVVARLLAAEVSAPPSVRTTAGFVGRGERLSSVEQSVMVGPLAVTWDSDHLCNPPPLQRLPAY